MENVSNKVELGNFINGLKPKIRVEVRILVPINTNKAFEGYPNSRLGWTLRSATTTSGGARPAVGGSTTTAKPYGEIQKLFDSELQKKSKCGLCYWCDDKWVPGHRYKKKELNVSLTHDEEGGTVEFEQQNESKLEFKPTKII